MRKGRFPGPHLLGLEAGSERGCDQRLLAVPVEDVQVRPPGGACVLEQTEPTQEDFVTVRALWEDDYTIFGIMDRTGLSYAVVKAAIRRAKEEARAR
jgi:hypothetical protein